MATLPDRAGPPWRTPPRRRPSLTHDVRADVVVVGGGITGLTTALLLARAGTAVTVLEAGTVGGGTTGSSTAKVSALQATRLSEIGRSHGDDAVARYAAAQVAGRDWILDRAGARGSRIALERRDAVTYAVSPDRAGEVEAEAAVAERAGLAVAVTDDVADLGFPVVRAVRLAEQAQIDPRAWVTDLASELDDLDVASLHEGTRVVDVDVRGRGVTTADGCKVTADHVVLATLLPISDRGALFAQMSPRMSHTIAVTLDGPLSDRFPMSYGVGEPTRSLRSAHTASGDAVLLVGGSGHVVGRQSPTIDEVEDLVSWTDARFPVTDVVNRWSAHDLSPVDDLPFVGRADPFPRAPWVATGFAKWGLTSGTAAAMTLSAAILGGDRHPWDGLFDPRRRRSVRGLARTATLNGGVAREMAIGWLRGPRTAGPEAPPVTRRAVVPCAAVPTAGAGDTPVDPDDPPPRVSLVCTHLGGVLHWNDAARTWDCPLHGSRFATDGTVVAGPAVRPLRGGEGVDHADATGTR